jgi:hypothetical protein
VDRFLPLVREARSDPCIQSVTFVRATNLPQIKDAVLLPEPVEARPHVLLACLTNPITNLVYDNLPSLLKHCDYVFTQIKTFIAESRIAVPGDMEQVCSVVFCAYNGIALIVPSLSISFFPRFILCPPCSVSRRSGTRETTPTSPPLSLHPSVSQSDAPSSFQVTQVRSLRETECI